jgi:hypothetical protein
MPPESQPRGDNAFNTSKGKGKGKSTKGEKGKGRGQGQKRSLDEDDTASFSSFSSTPSFIMCFSLIPHHQLLATQMAT